MTDSNQRNRRVRNIDVTMTVIVAGIRARPPCAVR